MQPLGAGAVAAPPSDANFAYYQLLLRPAGSSDSELGGDRPRPSQVINGALGTLNTSTLANGEYELAVNVVDVNGQATSTLVPIEIALDRKLGQFRISFTDVRVDATGMPLTLTRTYDSLKKDTLGRLRLGLERLLAGRHHSQEQDPGRGLGSQAEWL